MRLTPAQESDYAGIIELANLAYRGKGEAASWNTEEGILEGQRMSESLLREELAAKPQGHLLTLQEEGELLGTVWLDPVGKGVWYLGLLAVRPDQQKRRRGSSILEAAEEFARERGALRIRMTVLHVRTSTDCLV